MAVVTRVDYLWFLSLGQASTATVRWTSRLPAAANLAWQDRQRVERVVYHAFNRNGSSFWDFPRERTLCGAFEGLDVLSGQCHCMARLGDNAFAWPYPWVIAMSNNGEEQPLHCSLCERIGWRDSQRPPPVRAEFPDRLCPFHMHYVLTGERLLSKHVVHLAEAQSTVNYEWTWSHAIIFIEARANALPLRYFSTAPMAPIAAGSWLLDKQLYFEARQDQLRVDDAARRSRQSSPSEY